MQIDSNFNSSGLSNCLFFPSCETYFFNGQQLPLFLFNAKSTIQRLVATLPLFIRNKKLTRSVLLWFLWPTPLRVLCQSFSPRLINLSLSLFPPPASVRPVNPFPRLSIFPFTPLINPSVCLPPPASVRPI